MFWYVLVAESDAKQAKQRTSKEIATTADGLLQDPLLGNPQQLFVRTDLQQLWAEHVAGLTSKRLSHHWGLLSSSPSADQLQYACQVILDHGIHEGLQQRGRLFLHDAVLE